MKNVRILLTLTAFAIGVIGSFATMLPVAETKGKPFRTSNCGSAPEDFLVEGTCYVNGSGAQCHLDITNEPVAYDKADCSTPLKINP